MKTQNEAVGKDSIFSEGHVPDEDSLDVQKLPSRTPDPLNPHSSPSTHA